MEDAGPGEVEGLLGRDVLEFEVVGLVRIVFVEIGRGGWMMGSGPGP